MSAAVSFGVTCRSGNGPPLSLTRYEADAAAPRHRHETAYSCVVLRGGFIQSARTDCHASTGDLVVLEAGAWHSDRVGPRGALCLNLELDDRDAEVARRFRGRLRVEAKQVAGELAGAVARNVSEDSLLLDSLLAEFLGSLEAEVVVRPAHVVDRLIDAIESEPARPWRLAEAAAIVGLHPTHLARAFRQRTGLSIGAFRRSRLMTSLCVELRSSTMPLAQIAVAYGFADQAHMSRAVRVYAGLSPRQFQRLSRASVVQDRTK